MHAFRPLLLLALLVTMTSPVDAQEHRGVRYALPTEWRQSDQGDIRILTAGGLRQGEVVLILIHPAAAATNEPPARQFEREVAAANAGARVLGAGQQTAQPRGQSTFLLQPFTIDQDGIGPHSRLYAMLVDGGQRALVAVIFKPDSILPRYQNAVVAVLDSIAFTRAPMPAPAPPSVARGGGPSASGTPTGNTPTLHPGMPGWLPSGRGVPIPPSRIVDGKPQGIWWTTSYGAGQRATTFAFLPNGIHASNPRYGGGHLVDIEGQRQQPGANGVGPFTIAGGQITREYDGHRNTNPYTTGTDNSGAFFKIGAAIFRPITAATKQTIVGTWRSAGTKYVFHANDTYEMGQVTTGDGWATGSRASGAYSVDGHLVVMRPQGAPITITPMGLVTPDLLLIHGIFYRRS